MFVQIEVGGCMFCFTGGTTGQWSMFVLFLSLLFSAEVSEVLVLERIASWGL